MVVLVLDLFNFDYYYLLMDIYLDYFCFCLVLQIMEWVVVIVFNDIFLLLKLSEIQLFLKMNQVFLLIIDKVLWIDFQNVLVYFFIGKNFEEFGDINWVINVYQEFLEIDLEMIDIWIKLG